jgi:hypothetical protein
MAACWWFFTSAGQDASAVVPHLTFVFPPPEFRRSRKTTPLKMELSQVSTLF